MNIHDAGHRAAFLTDACRELLASRNYAATLQRLSDLAVPALADWCAVDMVRDEGGFGRLAVTHLDPEKVMLAHELWNRYPPRPTDAAGLANVVRTGQAELVPEISDALLASLARDEEHLRLARQLGLRSYLVVPLAAQGRVLGALTLVHAESGRRFGPDDLAFATEFAALAALAVDNARLFEAEVAARRRAELSERAFRTFIDNLPELAWTALPDGHIDYYNRRWYEYTGTTFEEMQGWGWQRVHDPALLPLVVERWKRSLETGEPFEMEFTLRSADGLPRWFLTRVSPMRDANGQVVRWFGTNTDIHELKAAQSLSMEMAAQSRETEALLLKMRGEKEHAELEVSRLRAALKSTD
jgi:PAS domain S-box-containing protein